MIGENFGDTGMKLEEGTTEIFTKEWGISGAKGSIAKAYQSMLISILRYFGTHKSLL